MNSIKKLVNQREVKETLMVEVVIGFVILCFSFSGTAVHEYVESNCWIIDVIKEYILW